MTVNNFGLPRYLGNGLLLRWGTPADADALAAFNVLMHSDNPEEPDEFIGHWTRDLMSGDHPTTKASDFTLVMDENDGGKIVSSMNLISQTWAYDGIPFGCGRPELVGTDADYRRRGLVRAQFEVIHAKSAARGELALAITGIPWYYRQFGYEMTLALGGGRSFFWNRPGNFRPVEAEMYRLRPAVEDDIPTLTVLYPYHCAHSLITRVRNEAEWRHELFITHRVAPFARHAYLVEDQTGTAIGYVEYRQWGTGFIVREIAVLPGYSLRAIALFLIRHFKAKADELNQTRQKKGPIDNVYFDVGLAHPVYEALNQQLEKQRPPYAWYIRVPDLPAFLHHIAPVLEKRLAASVMAGYTGVFRLNFYHSQLALQFEQGRLVDMNPFTPDRFFDGDAFYPDHTFLHLLFGHLSWQELRQVRADCTPQNAEAGTLLGVLFAKQPSQVVMMG